ncbi:methyl-accepting chemotaxis protein [Spirochaetia bacterium]|nr:methyl-accepting chemotaxis protein [Spirochaetia bacterium]GHU32682.1 methyl-accepting chemotaxis protein [Spirochaetia bacterium]
MNISKRISIFVIFLVLVVSISLGVITIVISTRMTDNNTRDSLLDQADLAASLVSTTIHAQLGVLQELANRARVQTLDFDSQKDALLSDIDRLGFLEFAIVDMTGRANYLKAGTFENLGDRDYIRKAQAGEQAISILVSRVLNLPVAMYAVPIYVDKRVSQVLLARSSADVFSNIVRNIGGNSIESAYLINNRGVIIAHPNVDFVMNQYSALETAKNDPKVQSEADAVQSMLSKKRGVVQYTEYSTGERELLSSFVPVPDYEMTLVISVEKAIVMREITLLRNLLTLVMIIFIGVGIICALIFARSIGNPLKYMVTIIKEVGKGDLTKRIEIQSKDEIGEIAGDFDTMVENIENLVITIRQQAQDIELLGNSLSENMSKTAAAVNEITATIKSIEVRVNYQSGSIGTTNAAIRHITNDINELNESIDRQTSDVSRSSSAIEEMLATIQSVTNSLVSNIDDVNELSSASGVGRAGLQEVAVDIREIAKESEGLQEINIVIENIASQTNLLSMNAAIEAAHAGIAGKGFAVVAGEIRKLSESSSKQSKTISSVLKKIKDSINKITHASDSVLNKFESINLKIKTVSDQEMHIRTAMEEQSTGSQQILDSVGELSGITQQVKINSDEMLDESKAIIQESRNLEHITEEINNGMKEIAIGAEEINVAMNHVNGMSMQNKKDISILLQEVSKFKVTSLT